MPELPEVETVRRALLLKLKNKKILDINIIYEKVFKDQDISYVKENICNQIIFDINRRGKWLIFCLSDYYLLSHLRMEGKFIYRDFNDDIGKHELVIFNINNEFELRYKDVRKFGKMYLISKDKLGSFFDNLGYEPWDSKLSPDYFLSKVNNKCIPIKTILLDQSIIAGIGNIYADEILFLSGINPYKRGCDITFCDASLIISNTKDVLLDAIGRGGTTIRSYTSEEGVTGLFQNDLNVHKREGKECPECGFIICREKINGRSSYFCSKCQKL